MVMFETLAVAAIAQFQHPRHGGRYFLLGLFFLLCAGYTKQLAVFTVVAALGFVFLRDIRRALAGGAGLALGAGGLFLLIDRATGGQWTVNIIHANVNEFDYRQTLLFLNQWLRLYPVLILLATGMLVWELFWDRLSVYSLWFVLAVGMGLLSGKWGAGPAYFTTSIAAACVMSGRALLRLTEAVSRRGAPVEERGGRAGARPLPHPGRLQPAHAHRGAGLRAAGAGAGGRRPDGPGGLHRLRLL